MMESDSVPSNHYKDGLIHPKITQGFFHNLLPQRCTVEFQPAVTSSTCHYVLVF